jgi:S-adenosylmethionine hydrolase
VGRGVKGVKTRVITLMSDFGLEDAYVAQMKGVILQINPRARIVDLCHSIAPQDVRRGAIIIGDSYRYFPNGTIHVCVVDPGVGAARKILCLATESGIFLAPDNGLLEIVIRNERRRRIFSVENREYFRDYVSPTFHGRDIFAPVAAHLSLGLEPQLLGPKVRKVVILRIPEPVFRKGVLSGEVVYADRFGNLITNITRSVFVSCFSKKETTSLKVKVGRRFIGPVMRTYSDAQAGEVIALFGSSERLEIAARCANAAKILSAKSGTPVSLSLPKQFSKLHPKAVDKRCFPQ